MSIAQRNRPDSVKLKVAEAIRMSDIARGGKRHSDESKRKISEALSGRSVPDERKEQISKTLKGRVFSEETKRKMSEAQKRRFSEKSLLKN
jgi:hypothetical protein